MVMRLQSPYGPSRPLQPPKREITFYEWSMAFGFDYPAVFVKPTSQAIHVFSTSKSGPLRKATHAVTQGDDSSETPPYWKNSPAVWTYRSLSRYLRRHVIPDDYRLRSHLVRFEYSRTAYDLIQAAPELLGAVAEMFWAHQLEPKVTGRRWPYRNPLNGVGALFSRPCGSLDLRARPDTTSQTYGQLDSASSVWLEYQWAGYVMLAGLRDCFQSAHILASGDFLASFLARIRFQDLVDWSACVSEAGTMCFSGVTLASAIPNARPCKDKLTRQADAARQKQQRNALVELACKGPCLKWAERDGWTVVNACAPEFGDWRRHVLLGIPGSRPRFWLFRNGALFVARLCSVRLQTSHSSAKQAIDLLRLCYRQYRRSPCGPGDTRN